MIVQKELVAIYDYEVPVPENPFSFRLEIHKCSELFTGSVYRLERFRLRPTFHQRDREDADPLINDALIYIRDECIDERKLRGESPETVIAIFNRELQNIFNQAWIINLIILIATGSSRGYNSFVGTRCCTGCGVGPENSK